MRVNATQPDATRDVTDLIVIELSVGTVDPTLLRYGTDLTATRLTVGKVNSVATLAALPSLVNQAAPRLASYPRRTSRLYI